MKKILSIWDRLSNRQWLCILLIGFLGFLMPMMYAMLTVIPRPGIHDEYCYVLQAQTFAEGRITNPTHEHWEHFQTFHVFHQPTYQVRYPPVQGIVLASGLIIFSDEAFGIWIGNALMMMALLWCLYAWVRARWATLLAMLVLLQLGVASYWVQSYWGGCVNVMSAALMLGAMGHLMKTRRTSWLLIYGLVLGLGLVLLANTRPFEGALLGMICAVWFLLNGLIRKRYRELGISIASAAVILCLGMGCWAMYNQALTGNYLVMPQQHMGTWYQTLLQEGPPDVPEHMRQFGDRFTDAHYNKDMQAYPNLAMVAAFLFNFYLFPIVLPIALLMLRLLFRRAHYIYNLIFITLLFAQGIIMSLMNCSISLILLSTLPLIVVLMMFNFSSIMRWLFGSVILLIGLQLIYYKQANIIPTNMHYYATLLPILLILVAKGTQAFCAMKAPTQLPSWSRGAGVGLAIGLACIFFLISTIPALFYTHEPHMVWFMREQTITYCLQQPGQDLVFVDYPEDHVVDWELVYNSPNIDQQEVIFAQKLTEEQNNALKKYYKNRTHWKLTLMYDENKSIQFKLDLMK